jgi:hypothetical protein
MRPGASSTSFRECRTGRKHSGGRQTEAPHELCETLPRDTELRRGATGLASGAGERSANEIALQRRSGLLQGWDGAEGASDVRWQMVDARAAAARRRHCE